jgi:hypothetical protein
MDNIYTITAKTRKLTSGKYVGHFLFEEVGQEPRQLMSEQEFDTAEGARANALQAALVLLPAR